MENTLKFFCGQFECKKDDEDDVRREGLGVVLGEGADSKSATTISANVGISLWLRAALI